MEWKQNVLNYCNKTVGQPLCAKQNNIKFEYDNT